MEHQEHKRLKILLELAKNEAEKLQQLTNSEAYKEYQKRQREDENYLILLILVNTIAGILVFGFLYLTYPYALK